MSDKLKRVTVILIAIAMILTGIAPAVFAEGQYSVTYGYSGSVEGISDVLPTDENMYDTGQMVTIKQPTETTVTSGGKDYKFKGWLLNGEKVEGSTYEMGSSNVEFDSKWETDATLSGTVYEYAYDKAKETGSAKSGAEITFLLKEGEELSVTSDSDGTFESTLADEKRTEDGKYSYSIEKDANTLGAEGEVSENADSKIYIRKRYEPKSSDYTIPDQEGVINNFVDGPGTYTIEGASGNQLTKTLDGDPSDSIEVEIGDDGGIEDFYVYKDGLCSKVLSGERVSFDQNAPNIRSVTTAPAKDGTYVKEHGIYSKVKAELLITAQIDETGAGLKEVYLIGVKDGEETRYDAVKVEGQSGKYNTEIALPDEETLKDAEVMYLVAVDNFGNTSERRLIARTEEGSSVTLEQIAPVITYEVSSAPNANGWYKTAPTITAKVTDENSGLEYIKIYQDGVKVKEKTYSDKKTDEQTLSAKADASNPTKTGSYAFKIEAGDNSGNISEEEFTIKIDTVAPVLSISGAEEGAYYSKAPSVVINETEKYSSEKENKITAVIKKEGRDGDKTYTSSGKDSLSIPTSEFSEDGIYTVRATALDAAGNAAETVTVKFTKDGTPPKVALEPTKKANSYGWYNYKPTLRSTAQDSLAGLETFSLTEDGKSLAYNEYDKITRNTQEITEKSKIATQSDDGSYQFIATATDRAGNTTRKIVNLKVDLVAPVLSASGLTDGRHYISVPTLRVSETEKHYKEQGAYIRYNIVRDNKVVAGSKSFKSVNEMQVPPKLFDTDGRYSITITAEDAAGNAAKSISYKIVRDSTSPIVRLSGASNGQFYNRSVTINLEVIERFYETNKVSTSATRTLGGTTNVGFPFTSTGETSSSSKTFSDTGTYNVTASAVDKAGNSSGTKSLSFTVDQKAPEITITGVEDGAVYTYGQTVAPSVKFFDDYPGSESVSYTKGGVPIANPSFEPLKENDGVYTLTAIATDKAGNTTTKTVTFTINRFGSYFIYSDAVKNVQGKAMKTLDTDLLITEKNVSKVIKSDAKILRDGKELEAKGKTTKKEEDAEKTYKHTFSKEDFTEEGAYEITVISKDEAGNEMESKEENGAVKFFVDRTAPTVTLSGIDPKGNKGEEITVNISTNDLLTGVKEVKAYVDGTEVEVTKNEADSSIFFKVGKGMRQEVKVTSEDGAGNIGEVIEEASVSPSSLSLFLNRFWALLAGIGTGLLALIGILLALLKRRKKEDEENN